MFILSSFAAFCEGYVELWPSLKLWAQLYTLRINSIQDPTVPLPKPIVQCGACIVVPRQKSPHVKMAGLESCRKWQRTFFYIKNTSNVDLINLPAYVPGERSQVNWLYNPKQSHKETNRIFEYIEGLQEDHEPTADDIVHTFIMRRVLPLQRRVHKICQMSGPLDPTKISTFELSKPDVVVKVKAIAKTKMPVDWKSGLEPFSRANPPPNNFRRQGLEEPAEFTADQTEWDQEDPDSVQNTHVHEMDAILDSGSGKPSAPSPSRARADDTGSDDDDCIILEVYDPVPISYAYPADSASADPETQVVENAVLLTIERPAVAKTSRAKRAQDSGPSVAAASKRRKTLSQGPTEARKRSRVIPTSSGARLEVNRSAPGRTPLPPKTNNTPHDEEDEEEAPLQMPNPSKGKRSADRVSSPAARCRRLDAGGSRSTPEGPTTSEGNTAPKTDDHRDGADFTSPPERDEDPGAGNMGAGFDQTGSSDPVVVPPVLDKSSSDAPPVSSIPVPPSPPPATLEPAGSTVIPPAPPTKSPGKTISSPGKPPVAPGVGKIKKKLASRRAPEVTPNQLSNALQATVAAPTSSKALTLHTSRAAASISDKLVMHTSRIMEKSRSDESLGSLEHYADAWNNSDLTDVTSGLGKDGQDTIDSRGPRPIIQQLGQLKRYMRETDMAWFDVDKNVSVVLESRKKLYEDLLWEHRELSNAHKALQIAHQAKPQDSSQLEELVGRVATLQGEKETLSSQHLAELQKQREETARLKEELIQLKLQHNTDLKQAAEAGKIELDHARKELNELHAREMKEVQDQLHGELKAEKDLRELEKKSNDVLQEVRSTQAKIIADLDEKVWTTFPESQARAVEAVAKTRHGDLASDAGAWTTEEYLTALSARVSYMGKLGKLPDIAIRVFSNLWPGETVPNRVEVIASRLMESSARLNEWRRSAARSGADTALRFVYSWYEGIDLDALETLRSGAPTDTDPALRAKCQQRAYQLAHYAPTSQFIPAPPKMEDEESGDEESDAEEAADEEIIVEGPTAKPVDSAPQGPASSSQAPGSSPSDAPEACAA
ncbi:hypothetical protein ACQ4PT_023559 [Festuca glaucescens]